MRREGGMMHTQKIKSITAAILTLCCLIPEVSHAVWLSKGPTGAYVNTLFCSETDSTVVFAGTEGGLYKTSDSGATWVYKGFRARDVEAVAMRIACGEIVVAGASSDLYESLDGGDTWTLRASLPEGVKSLGITYPPECYGYAGTETGVFATNGNHGLFDYDIQALAVDSSNNVYAATEGDGVFKTTNDGVTWTPMNKGLSFLTMNDLKIDGNNNIFAATSGGGVFISDNGGESWTPKNSGLPDISGLYFVDTLAKDTVGNLYAGVIIDLMPLTGAVYKSTNNGESWIQTDNAINGFYPESMCITPNNRLFVGTTYGIYRTDDFGQKWVNVTDNIIALEFNDSFVRDAGGNLFISSDGGGIYRTSDGGRTWLAVGTGDAGDSNDLLIDNLGNMYAAGTDVYGVMKSIDNGNTWFPASSGLPSYSFYGLIMFEEPMTLGMDGNGNIYVGYENGDVYKTVNQGESWGATSPLPFAGGTKEILSLFGEAGNTIYAGTEDEGVFKSIDGGITWIQNNTGIPDGAEIETFFKDVSSGYIYIGVDGTGSNGLYRSLDGGDHWIKVPTPAAGCYVSSITMDQQGNLYAVFCNTAVYVSPDQGTTWVGVNNGLTPGDYLEGIDIRGIYADGKNNILLATNGSGMFRLSQIADINIDDRVDISDVILVLRLALQLDPPAACSDINEDGQVDISDVILTLRMALGLDEWKPCVS
jgi:photosystem II stability/assembly factor-like uncharacterized protein